jgi:hypothetical protein
LRRFKQSLFARLTGKAIIAVLMSNFVMFGLGVQQANAQFRTGTKQWAVLDFVNKSKVGGAALGGAATDAVSTLLLGTNKYDILPRETVERVMAEQELTPPLTRQLDILRVSQALGVETVITGEVQDARVNHSANGKSADIILVVKGIDVASGLVVLGSAVHGQSSERPGDVSDDVVINEALSYAAQQAVSQMLALQVDVATVLTTPTVSSVVLNKGSRQGIKMGMTMVVTRGREQVATVRVSEVSQDVSTCTVVKSFKGIAPGDRARAVVGSLPTVTLTGSGAKIRTTRRSDPSSALLALLVVGALALTIQSGGGDTGPGDFITEATVLDDGITPGVKCSWKPSIFSGGRGRVEWQVWRNDYQPTPVLIVNGVESRALDFPAPRTLPWRNMGTVIGGTECVDDPGQEDFDNPAPGINAGTTYFYLLSLVYKVSSLDLPGGGTGGAATDCFFQTGRQSAMGSVTPIDPLSFETSRLPANGSSVIRDGVLPQPVQFQWGSAPGANQYIVEISTRLDFRGSVRVAGTLDSTLSGTLGLEPVDIQPFFPAANRLYWRVGARNAADVPGPVKDSIGERYVFGRVYQIDRENPPPPPKPVFGKGKGG